MSMRYSQVVLTIFLYIGTITSMEDGVVSAEATASDNKIYNLEIPALLLPCKPVKGDMFYFVYERDVVEIRCGEPPL